jgi:hypothetical protein
MRWCNNQLDKRHGRPWFRQRGDATTSRQEAQEAMVKTKRWRNNKPDKRHGRPWRNKVAVAVAVDVDWLSS